MPLSKLANFLFSVDVGNAGQNGFPTYEPPTLASVLALGVNLINTFLFTVALVLLVIMIAYAGGMRLLAMDNPQAVKQSSQVLFYAIIGYVVALVGFLLIGLATGVVNFTGGVGSLFKLTLPTN